MLPSGLLNSKKRRCVTCKGSLMSKNLGQVCGHSAYLFCDSIIELGRINTKLGALCKQKHCLHHAICNGRKKRVYVLALLSLKMEQEILFPQNERQSYSSLFLPPLATVPG